MCHLSGVQKTFVKSRYDLDNQKTNLYSSSYFVNYKYPSKNPFAGTIHAFCFLLYA